MNRRLSRLRIALQPWRNAYKGGHYRSLAWVHIGHGKTRRKHGSSFHVHDPNKAAQILDYLNAWRIALGPRLSRIMVSEPGVHGQMLWWWDVDESQRRRHEWAFMDAIMQQSRLLNLVRIITLEPEPF